MKAHFYEMTRKLEILRTGDGSLTLLINEEETFHSRYGALMESIHVFIENGLSKWCANSANGRWVNVLEYGFGTGLNAFLAMQYAEENCHKVRYQSLEAYPVEWEIVRQMEYSAYWKHPDAESWWNDLHKAPWNECVKISPFFELEKIKKNFEDYVPQVLHSVDVIFFDAFASSYQPKLWTAEMIKKTIKALKAHGIWVTYAAKGSLRRDLESLGLSVERLPGPPGKREMIRATLEKHSC